jgi:hypothetical protein
MLEVYKTGVFSKVTPLDIVVVAVSVDVFVTVEFVADAVLVTAASKDEYERMLADITTAAIIIAIARRVKLRGGAAFIELDFKEFRAW